MQKHQLWVTRFPARKMKSFLLLVVLAVVVEQSVQDACGCHWRELDLCAATALVSMQGNPVPQSEEEVNEQCIYITEAVDCVTNYTNKCMTPLHRELLSFAIEGSQNSIKEYCTSGSDLRKLLLQHSKCLADAWDAQRSCILDAQAGVEAIGEKPFDQRLTVVCCTFQRFTECSLNNAIGKCGEEIREVIQQFTAVFMSDLPNVLCNGYGSDNEKCKGMLPPSGTPPKGGDSESAISRAFGMYLSLDS